VTASQKTALSLLITIFLCALGAILAYAGLFDLLETRLYSSMATSLFAFSLPMELILLLAVFLTIFLAVFLIFNLKQDNMAIIQNRLKELLVSLIRNYYEQKAEMDWEHWGMELVQRREDVRAELKRGIKIGDGGSSEEKIDAFIDKYWDELLEIIGCHRKVEAVFDEEELRNILSRALQAALQTVPASVPEAQAAVEAAQPPDSNGLQAGEAGGALESLEAENLEELEVIEEADDLETLEEPETLGEFEEIVETAEELKSTEEADETVEELESIEEIDDIETLEEPEALGEFEEIAETAEELETIEEADETVEELETIEEADDIEEIEAVEEIAEEAESAIGPQRKPIGQRAGLLALAEKKLAKGNGAEPEELEELEELSEADDAPDVQEPRQSGLGELDMLASKIEFGSDTESDDSDVIIDENLEIVSPFASILSSLEDGEPEQHQENDKG